MDKLIRARLSSMSDRRSYLESAQKRVGLMSPTTAADIEYRYVRASQASVRQQAYPSR